VNPDTILNPDPSSQYKDDSPMYDGSGNVVSGTGAQKTYMREVRYIDGRIERTWYRYGSNEQVGQTQIARDDKQVAEWDKMKPPYGQMFAPDKLGNLNQWNPQTKAYDIPTGQTAASTTDPQLQRQRQLAADEAEELNRQRQANKALPPDQDPAWETDAERRKRAEDKIQQQGVEAERQRQAQRQAEADTRAAAGEARAAAAADRPQTTYKVVNGVTYKVTVDPQGNETVTKSGLPADVKDDQVTTVDGRPAVVRRDASGRATGIEVLPVTGAGLQGEPPGAPPPDFTPGNVAKSLTDYSTWINQHVTDGSLDASTASRLMAARHQLAQTAVSEQANVANVASGVYGHQVSERNADVGTANARLGASTSGFVSVLQAIQNGAKAQPKGSDAAGRAFHGLLNAQIEHARNFGGLTDVPRTPVPASVAPYLTVQLPGGHTMQITNPAAPAGQTGPGAPAIPPVQQPVTSTPGVGVPTDPNAMASANASGFGSAASYQSMSPSATSAAAPQGQLPPHIAAMADSRPTGNAMADLEMAMTAAGMTPQAIAEARQRFLQGNLAQMTVGGGMALPGGQGYALPPIQG
jgi:hypothetical protein